MPNNNNLVKYAILFNTPEAQILLEDKLENNSEITNEKQRVVEKLVKSKLGPNERKKIVSKKNGKWLCLSEELGLTGIVLVHDDYPERLGYKMLDTMLEGALKQLGENYINQKPNDVQNMYKEKLHRLVLKYNKPEEFDSMMKVQRKV